jgi:endoglucanase
VGNHLVDSRNGEVFVPRGVNWPSFEYACSNGYGYSNSASGNTVGPNAAGAAVIARWHINMVRLPLNQDCWLGDDGLPRFGNASGYRAAVSRWVRTLNRAGIAVMLDLHWAGPDGVVADGLRVMADARSDDFWRSVARKFKGNRSVSFDVFNEPYTRYADTGIVFDLTWECWLRGGCTATRAHLGQQPDGSTFATIGMQALVDAVRATGARQPILLSGRGFGNDLGSWLAYRPADKQLVASFHNYNFQPCRTRTCWDETIAPVAKRVPVVAAEFGATDCNASHVRRFMRWADRRGVGYLMWAWWVLPGTPCSKEVMLRNVRGAARRPNGTAFKAHLAGLAARISLGGPGSQVLDSGVEVRVRCNKPCGVRARGHLLVGGLASRPGRSGTLRLRHPSGGLPAGRTRTFSLEVPQGHRAAASAALRQGRSVLARITIVARAHSLESRKSRVVRLRAY